jgi:hypothetical protein
MPTKPPSIITRMYFYIVFIIFCIWMYQLRLIHTRIGIKIYLDHVTVFNHKNDGARTTRGLTGEMLYTFKYTYNTRVRAGV